MRSTFGQLITNCFDITQNQSNTTNTTLKTFFKNEINSTCRFIYADLRNHQTTRAQTFTTVASQQYYHNPPDLMDIETVTITVGSVTYTLTSVDSQRRWDELNNVTFSGVASPTHFFQRRDDFGIWPIPQGAYSAKLNYTYRLKNMTADDYSTATISLTNGSVTVTGSGTTFTSAMTGRWLIPTTDGYAYRIASYSSATSIALDNYFQGTTISGDTYVIGESPEIPPDMHEFIPYRVAERYFSGVRKDKDTAVFWSNMFWTGDPYNTSRDMKSAQGGYLGAKKRYSLRSNSRIIRRGRRTGSYLDRLWGTTIS